MEEAAFNDPPSPGALKELAYRLGNRRRLSVESGSCFTTKPPVTWQSYFPKFGTLAAPPVEALAGTLPIKPTPNGASEAHVVLAALGRVKCGTLRNQSGPDWEA